MVSLILGSTPSVKHFIWLDQPPTSTSHLLSLYHISQYLMEKNEHPLGQPWIGVDNMVKSYCTSHSDHASIILVFKTLQHHGNKSSLFSCDVSTADSPFVHFNEHNIFWAKVVTVLGCFFKQSVFHV